MVWGYVVVAGMNTPIGGLPAWVTGVCSVIGGVVPGCAQNNRANARPQLKRHGGVQMEGGS